jgi:hypothetical protein
MSVAPILVFLGAGLFGGHVPCKKPDMINEPIRSFIG